MNEDVLKARDSVGEVDVGQATNEVKSKKRGNVGT